VPVCWAARHSPNSPTDREAVALDALALARQLPDPATLARDLCDVHGAIWSPDSLDERIVLATEACELAQHAGDAALWGHAQAWRILDLAEAGDAAIHTAVDAATAVRSDPHSRLPHIRAAYALLRGRFHECEQLSEEAIRLAGRRHDEPAGLWSQTLLFVLRSRQARLDECEFYARANLDRFGNRFSVRCGIVQVANELGRVDEVRTEFELLAHQGFENLTRDYSWMVSMAALAQACVTLGDTRAAATLYDALLPFQRRVVVVGHPCGYIDHPVALYLGMLATLRARPDAAATHFKESLAVSARLGAAPSFAQTQYEYARMLLSGGDPSAHAQADGLIERALSSARRLGMHGLAAKADRFRSDRLAAMPATTAAAGENAPAPVGGALHTVALDREGELWALTYGGTTVRLKDAKGLRYLALLLRDPGREMHATELVAAVERLEGQFHERANLAGTDVGWRSSLGDSGSALDERAKAEYRRRLVELQGEIDAARATNDPQRITQAVAEAEFLGNQLQQASGIGGRRAGSHAERARINVTRGIAAALRKIGAHHPQLRRYLSRTIRTGTFCVYRPGPAGGPH
jgi:hypothetical protein